MFGQKQDESLLFVFSIHRTSQSCPPGATVSASRCGSHQVLTLRVSAWRARLVMSQDCNADLKSHVIWYGTAVEQGAPIMFQKMLLSTALLHLPEKTSQCAIKHSWLHQLCPDTFQTQRRQDSRSTYVYSNSSLSNKQHLKSESFSACWNVTESLLTLQLNFKKCWSFTAAFHERGNHTEE